MDTNRLHYLCAVAQTGSLRQAAELVGVSPAALSKALRVLAGEVGYELLLPVGRGIAGSVAADRGGSLLMERPEDRRESLLERCHLGAAFHAASLGCERTGDHTQLPHTTRTPSARAR